MVRGLPQNPGIDSSPPWHHRGTRSNLTCSWPLLKSQNKLNKVYLQENCIQIWFQEEYNLNWWSEIRLSPSIMFCRDVCERRRTWNMTRKKTGWLVTKIKRLKSSDADRWYRLSGWRFSIVSEGRWDRGRKNQDRKLIFPFCDSLTSWYCKRSTYTGIHFDWCIMNCWWRQVKSKTEKAAGSA